MIIFLCEFITVKDMNDVLIRHARQTAVSAQLKSKQILHFGLVW